MDFFTGGIFSQLSHFQVPTAADIVTSAIIFLVLFILIALAFARRRLIEFFLGLLFTFARIFSSPFIYVQRTAQEISRIPSEAKAPVAEQEQYLITRILLTLRGAIAAIGIAILAMAVVKACSEFRPDAYLRTQEDSAQQRLDRTTSQRDSFQAIVAQQDKDWTAQRGKVLADDEDARKSTLTAQAVSMQQLERSCALNPDELSALQAVKAFLARKSPRSQDELAEEKGQTDQLISMTNAPDPEKLKEYVGSWEAYAEATLPQNELAVRHEFQKTYLDNVNHLSELNAQVQAFSNELAGIRNRMEYHPGTMLIDFVLGIISFMGFVWVWGLASEVLLLAVCIARDVRLIRTARVEGTTAAGPVQSI